MAETIFSFSREYFSGRKTLSLMMLFFVGGLLSGDLARQIDLQGEWRFEIGDNLDFALPSFNDAKWTRVQVPDAWENQGFPGYDGYGWYRITFVMPGYLRNKMLFFKLGQIDDVDRVYFNGHLIGGRGDFPPRYNTAFNVNRVYQIPGTLVQFDRRNTLAVRVFDLHGSGGIVHGEVGIYTNDEFLPLFIDLSGPWRFKAGDDTQFALKDFNDTVWRTIIVPSFWDQQGFSQVGSYAWYRKSFYMDNYGSNEKMILVLGKIKEMDQVFFNGRQIGETGMFQSDYSNGSVKYRDQERAYFIPPDLIQKHGMNTIAVRVYDAEGCGGIYGGFVGICTREEFLRYTKRKK
ncbi:MAG: glycoside hydrolase [candidate division KSB1 bacterium]|nr:glycoside hydrolase [candidate division KSB1 bacterium]